MRPYLLAGIILQPLLWVGVSRLGVALLARLQRIDKLTTAGFHVQRPPRRMPCWTASSASTSFRSRSPPLCALALALVRRDRRALWLFAAAAAWLVTDIALAVHGELPSPRYMFEAAAVEVTLIGAGVGWILASTAAAGRAALGWSGARPWCWWL